MISPRVELLEKECPDVQFLKVNVDTLPDVAQKAAIAAMPTFILYRAGVVVESFVGADERKLRDLVRKHAPIPA